MRGPSAFVLALGIAGTCMLGAIAQAPARAAPADQVERGRYLVQKAGLCADCHGSMLAGAKLDFLAPGLPVAHKAPRIAGLPHLSVNEAIAFLETGLLPTHKRARPPMPQYRFNAQDAAAITAYLKSLT
jgi:mono/diheme cytochrome c family protein